MDAALPINLCKALRRTSALAAHLDAWIAAENKFIDAVTATNEARHSGIPGAHFDRFDEQVAALRALFEARRPIDVALRLAQESA